VNLNGTQKDLTYRINMLMVMKMPVVKEEMQGGMLYLLTECKGRCPGVLNFN
jgi:hypothetical protein